MRRVFSVLLTSLLIAGASSAFAQQGVRHVTWSLDPVSHMMKATPWPAVVLPGTEEAESSSTTTATTYTGTVDVKVTVKLVSTVPAGASISCNANLDLEYSVKEQSSTSSLLGYDLVGSYSEGTNAVISGKTATCSFTIPYSWTVPASTSTITITVDGITAGVSLNEYVDTASTSTTGATSRGTSVELDGPSTMPANGTTTKLTASTVL
jgi:hypothetical protein